MIRRVQKNNETIFKVPMALEIDLDALNSVASGENSFLCKCVYQTMGRKHNLIYQSQDLNLKSIKEYKMSYIDVCRLLEEVMKLIDYIQIKRMYLKNIWLKMDSIYIKDEQFMFIYLPLRQKKDMSAKDFCLKLLGAVRSVDKEVALLKKHIKELETYQQIKEYAVTLGTKEQLVVEVKASTCESEEETTLLNRNTDNIPESEGETTILSQQTTAFMVNDFSECETTVLSDMPIPDVREKYIGEGIFDLYLLRVSSGEKIHINKPAYSIGKDVNCMDYVLGNASVSRNHATIYSEEDKFYLVDNGSTNGSTLEGVRICEGERVELEDGYIVSLGNEVFQILLERKIL